MNQSTNQDHQSIEAKEKRSLWRKVEEVLIFTLGIGAILYYLIFVSRSRLAILVAIVLIGIPFYFLPTFIAFSRRKRNKGAIFALNLCLGWTLIGWVISLVWALTYEVK